MWRDTVAKEELVRKFKIASKTTPTQAQYFNKEASRRVHDLE